MVFKSKLYFLVLICFASAFLGEASAQRKKVSGQSNLIKTVDKYIVAQSTDGATEYRKARRVVEGDIDSDGDKDVVVQYTLEGFGGGNLWGQSVAVFINNKGSYKAVADEGVGGKFSRTFSLQSVAKGKIVGATETCPDMPQGLCDNPKKETVVLRFANNKLKEQ